MRILAIAGELPVPPDLGGRIRMHGILTRLAQRHEVHLVALTTDREYEQQVRELNQLFASVVVVARPLHLIVRPVHLLRSLIERRPYINYKFSSRRLRHAIRAALATVQPDAVLVSYHLLADNVPKIDRPLIVDFHNTDFVLYERFALSAHNPLRRLHARVQARLMRKFEAGLPWRAHLALTTSEPDAARLRKISGAENVRVVPNGVNVHFFQPHVTDGVPFDVVFLGGLHYYPNEDAALYLAREVMPQVWKRRSDTTVALVGGSPSRRITSLVQDPRIVVTGRVPDVRPYFEGARAFLVPLRIGGGTRLKALEAAAMGCAIVGTSIGLEGLGFQHGVHALIADTTSELAAAVSSVLDDPSLRSRLGAAARSFVEQHFAWDSVVDRLEQCLPDEDHTPAGYAGIRRM